MEADTMSKKIYLVLSIVFAILTFAGAGYVLINKGKPNAGYAIIPMVFELLCVIEYKKRK